MPRVAGIRVSMCIAIVQVYIAHLAPDYLYRAYSHEHVRGEEEKQDFRSSAT